MLNIYQIIGRVEAHIEIKDTFYSDNYLEKHFSFSFQSGVNFDFGIFMFAFSANIEYKKIAYQVN
jgi:hypothetical protein